VYRGLIICTIFVCIVVSSSVPFLCVSWSHHLYHSPVQKFFFFVSTQGNSNSHTQMASV